MEVYNVFGPIKDVFTAGGRKPLYGTSTEVPALFHHFSRLLPDIADLLQKDGLDIIVWAKEAIEWVQSSCDDTRNQLAPEAIAYIVNRIETVTKRGD